MKCNTMINHSQIWLELVAAASNNDTLGIRTRALLYGAGLPAKYWSAALVHSVYLPNRLVHSSTLSTPFGLYYGVKPDLEFLRTFGSRVCVASARCCEGRMRNHALLPLQGSGAVCAPLRERDLEHNQDRAGTSGRVPYPRRIPDGAETQTPQRFVWELDITLDEGRARGVWSSLREGVHQYTPCYDCDVCGEPSNISGRWWWEQELGLFGYNEWWPCNWINTAPISADMTFQRAGRSCWWAEVAGKLWTRSNL
jgi:hypothetical protein